MGCNRGLASLDLRLEAAMEGSAPAKERILGRSAGPSSYTHELSTGPARSRGSENGKSRLWGLLGFDTSWLLQAPLREDRMVRDRSEEGKSRSSLC